MRKLGLALLLLLPAAAQNQTLPDEAIWSHFEAWVAKLPALPPGERILMETRYTDSLQKEGVSSEEAARRFARINTYRRGSDHRERVYWDGSFKSGGGPDEALLLLQETVRKMKPGRALDAGMGRGRNTIYLASLGWDAHGYDMSADALQVAQDYARKAGVKIQTTVAKHDSFPFGERQWDLIICAYCYMTVDDPQWPAVFHKALRPGGMVVYQSSLSPRRSVAQLAEHWKMFRLLRAEDIDAGVVDNDWSPSRTYPTVRLVLRKE